MCMVGNHTFRKSENGPSLLRCSSLQSIPLCLEYRQYRHPLLFFGGKLDACYVTSAVHADEDMRRFTLFDRSMEITVIRHLFAND